MRTLHALQLPLACLAAGVIASAIGHAAEPPAKAEPENVAVQLIAEHTSVIAGQQQQFGLLLRHAPHWHTYWINPGDSGLPTTLSWTLPPGYKADEITWPTPRRFEVGGLYNFGYDGEVLLPVAIDVPADATAGSTAHFAVQAKWLVCREECVPGKADLTLDLPVERGAAKPDPRWTTQFSDARLAQPQATAWKGDAHVEGDRVRLTLRGPSLPPTSDGLDAFPVQRKLFDNKPPTVRLDGDALVVEAGKSEYFSDAPTELDMVVTAATPTGTRGWRVRIPFAASGTGAAP